MSYLDEFFSKTILASYKSGNNNKQNIIFIISFIGSLLLISGEYMFGTLEIMA